MPPKVITLHGHHHWNEHVRDIGRCRFAKYKNETYVIMLRWSKTKPNIISTYYTKYYELAVIDLWNFMRSKANDNVLYDNIV